MIGILGGGQLSVFLIEAAHRLGKKVRVLVTDSDEPAAKVADESVLDRSDEDLGRFLHGIEVLLFESENIDLDRVEKLIEKKTHVVPSVTAMRTLQDKGLQKRLLDELEIPTAPFRMEPVIDGGWILKRARGGYDGRGNYLGKDPEEAKAFIAAAATDGAIVYSEERVEIARELAVIATRTAEGKTVSFPVVYSTQTNGVCDLVQGPANALGLSPGNEENLFEMAQAIANSVDLVGTFAVEFFETKDGEFIVNEIAPRVHNSGHFTLDAAATSQFEQHICAALGLPLGPTRTEGYFIMKNCLGTRTSARPNAVPHFENWDTVRYYDYGKTMSRPGRKMGHLTTSGDFDDRQACDDGIKRAFLQWQINEKLEQRE